MEYVNASRVRHVDKNHRGPVYEASGGNRSRKRVLHRSVRPARAHAALLALDLTLFWEILLRLAGIQKQSHTNDLQERCAEKVPRLNGSRGWHQVPNGSFDPKGIFAQSWRVGLISCGGKIADCFRCCGTQLQHTVSMIRLEERATGNRMVWIVVVGYGRNAGDGATSIFSPAFSPEP